MVEEETLLTDLCAICHVSPIKYTCPRCGIHTCALPCVRRHKLWAQCSGVRDPAAYRKRSELATAASIDQDFNFITKVERSLQRAENKAQGKGIDIAPAGTIRPHAPHKSKIEAGLEANGIVLVKAPKGMSRSKQNKSQFDSKQKCMLWTVEWILSDNSRVFTNNPDTRTILEAYQGAVGKRGSRKRPREDDEAADLQKKSGILHRHNPEESGISAALLVGSTPPGQDGVHFFLHRPNVPSKYKCLIPILPGETIARAVRNRTLLEFPTIHVRREASNRLVAPFISEETYLEQHVLEIPINLPTYGHNNTEEGEISGILDTLDKDKVLEVLRKDIVG